MAHDNLLEGSMYVVARGQKSYPVVDGYVLDVGSNTVTYRTGFIRTSDVHVLMPGETNKLFINRVFFFTEDAALAQLQKHWEIQMEQARLLVENVKKVRQDQARKRQTEEGK